MPITIQSGTQQLGKDDQIHAALSEGLSVTTDPDGTTWTFPGSGPDGRIGKLCVSRYHLAKVVGAKHALAVHITFSIKGIFVPSLGGAEKKTGRIKVDLMNLHFTMRPESVQLDVSSDRALSRSIPGRELSDHRGTLNDWGFMKDDELCNDLATNLEFEDKISLGEVRSAISSALAPYSGAYLARFRDKLVASLGEQIGKTLLPETLRGQVVISIDFV